MTLCSEKLLEHKWVQGEAEHCVTSTRAAFSSSLSLFCIQYMDEHIVYVCRCGTKTLGKIQVDSISHNHRELNRSLPLSVDVLSHISHLLWAEYDEKKMCMATEGLQGLCRWWYWLNYKCYCSDRCAVQLKSGGDEARALKYTTDRPPPKILRGKKLIWG